MYRPQVAGNETLWGEYFAQPCSSSCSSSNSSSGGGDGDGRLAEWLSWLDLGPSSLSPIPASPTIEPERLQVAESKTSSGSSCSGGCSSSRGGGSGRSSSSSSSSSSLRDWLVVTLRQASQERHRRDLDSC